MVLPLCIQIFGKHGFTVTRHSVKVWVRSNENNYPLLFKKNDEVNFTENCAPYCVWSQNLISYSLHGQWPSINGKVFGEFADHVMIGIEGF